MKIFWKGEIKTPVSYRQTMRIRKAGMIVLFTCLWMVSATVSFSQEKKISLKAASGTIRELCSEIERNSDYRFIFSDDVMKKLDNAVTLGLTEGLVEDILKNLAAKAGVAYKIYGKQVVLSVAPAGGETKKAPPQVRQEMVKLIGTVTDKRGYPVPGVAVYIPNTNVGTSTDIEGNYQLWLPKDAPTEIFYSCIGMKEVQFNFAAKKDEVHDVTLEEEQISLEDVVVIGYGNKSKRDITSSISSVTSEEMEKYNNGAITFDNLLGGAVKGVLVQQSSGKPGSASTINIRGITSPASVTNTNEPLYVIDGVPFFLNKNADILNPLMTISPSDIKSIDVLKDAAATAIYGSRGANGVIIVNTISGQRNQRMKVHAGYSLTIGNPVKRYKPLNRAEFINLQDRIIRNTLDAVDRKQIDPDLELRGMPGFTLDDPYLGVRPVFNTPAPGSGEQAKIIGYEYDKINEEYFGKDDTDWVKETQNKNALTHQYSVGVRGGTETTSYSISLNAVNQEGTFIHENLERYGARISLDSDVSRRFNTGATLNYSWSKRRLGSDLSSNAVTKEWIYRPDLPVKYPDGTWSTVDGAFEHGMPVRIANPVAARGRQNTNEASSFTGNSYIECYIAGELRVRADISLSMFNDEGYIFYPTYAQDDYTGLMDKYAEARDKYSESSGQHSNSRQANSSVSFRADYDLYSGKHHAAFMAGYSWDRLFASNSSFGLLDFPDDFILTNISSARDISGHSGTKSVSGLNSVFARASYNYDDKYLAELNFRSDASSKFGPENRRGYFPAFSLGWRMSQENFLKKLTSLSDLKLRLSFGQTGSTNVDDFTFRQFFSRTSAVLYEGVLGVIPSTVFPNRGVKWEMTTEYNGGLDFAFFEYRLFGSFDLYYRFTKGALCQSPMPYETGATEYHSNLIDMSNRGVEFEIGGHIIRNKELTWTSKFNISFNRNRVEKLNDPNIDEFQLDAFKDGQPAGILQGYVVEKIFRTDEEVARLNEIAKQKNPGIQFYQEQSTGAGDYKFRDINGDGRITADDRAILASPEPRFFGGFLNTFSYKKLSLSVAFQFSHGTKSLREGLNMSGVGELGKNIDRELYNNTWTPENPDARYARLVLYDPNQNTRISDRYVFSTSYLRLKNISLSWVLPETLLNKLGIESVMLFASASNLWTLTKWPGLDPEALDTQAGIAGYTMNEDPYPLSKNFSVGIKLEF